MDKNRKGEIALAILKHRISTETKLADLVRPVSKTDAGRIAKAIGVKADELIEFMQAIKQEILAEIATRLKIERATEG